MVNFVSIEKFQAITHEGNLIVVGMGSDGWVYQYFGEEGRWNRLSKAFPGSINLPGSEANSVTTTSMEEEVVALTEEAPVEAAPEPEAPVAA